MSGAWEKVLIFVAMLCHPGHGFLARQTDIGARVGFTGAAWIEQCRDAKMYADGIRKRTAPRQRKSRDPVEPIRATLDLENPLDGIAEMLERHEACRRFTGGIGEALWVRDHLLLMLPASNPLRAKNLKELTYRADDRGQLRKDSTGRWRIVIGKEHFKNEKGAARDRDYEQDVHEDVWPLIEIYLREYRRMLDPSDNDRVFLSTDKKSRGKAWYGLNRHFESLTRRYLHGCPGSGPQCIRHIVATALVKAKREFVTAALVLHDREDTVRRNYGHLLSNDGARAYSDVIKNAFKKK